MKINWGRMDCATPEQLVNLLCRIDPDSSPEIESTRQAKYEQVLEITLAAIRARTLPLLKDVPGQLTREFDIAELRAPSRVKTMDFLRWAHAKRFSIPPPLKRLLSSDIRPRVAEDERIVGIRGLRTLIRENGLILGDDAAVRSFAKSAGIIIDGDNVRHEKRWWSRKKIVPLIRKAIERRTSGKAA